MTTPLESLDLLRENFLLSALAREEQEQVLAHLEPVELKSNEIIYQSEDHMEQVYFPVDSVISSLAIMMEGATTEVAMTGREGLVGIAALFGAGRAQHWTRVQVKGTALRMKTEEMVRLFQRHEGGTAVNIRSLSLQDCAGLSARRLQRASFSAPAIVLLAVDDS